MSAVDPAAQKAVERTAARLGGIAQRLDGAVSRSEDLAARDRFLASLGTSSKTGARPILLAALVASLMLSAVGVLLLRSGPAGLGYEVTGPAVADGEWLGAPPDRGLVGFHFSEGTEIELGPGSKGRVTAVTTDGARVVLGSGELHARVMHRQRAQWTVAAGPYDIEVTGTVFDVGWSSAGERLEVSLHDGSVIVHGPSLASGVRVVAGQRLVATVHEGGAKLTSLFESAARTGEEPSKVAPFPPPVAPEAPEPGGNPPPRAPAETPLSWSELVSTGNFRAVLDAAGARGMDQTVNHGSLRDLVALSDAARYAGDRALAHRGLLAQRSRFASSNEARAAAFVLGRMADDGGSAREALDWYDGYLREAPRGAFAAEALGRRLVVLVRLGNKDGARSAAESYLGRFPRGAHAAYARELLKGP